MYVYIHTNTRISTGEFVSSDYCTCHIYMYVYMYVYTQAHVFPHESLYHLITVHAYICMYVYRPCATS